jgi:hypothetical protein
MHEDHGIAQKTKRKRAIEEDSHFSSPSASSKSSKRSGLLIVPDMVRVTPVDRPADGALDWALRKKPHAGHLCASVFNGQAFRTFQ